MNTHSESTWAREQTVPISRRRLLVGVAQAILITACHMPLLGRLNDLMIDLRTGNWPGVAVHTIAPTLTFSVCAALWIVCAGGSRKREYMITVVVSAATLAIQGIVVAIGLGLQEVSREMRFSIILPLPLSAATLTWFLQTLMMIFWLGVGQAGTVRGARIGIACLGYAFSAAWLGQAMSEGYPGIFFSVLVCYLALGAFVHAKALARTPLRETGEASH